MRKISPRYYAYILLLFIVVIAIISVSGCTHSKKLRKSRTDYDSTAITHSIITQTITERIDTIIAIASATISGTKAIGMIQAGDSVFEQTPELTITTKEIN